MFDSKSVSPHDRSTLEDYGCKKGTISTINKTDQAISTGPSPNVQFRMADISESLEYPGIAPPKMNSIILLNEEKRKELGFSSPKQQIKMITEETLVTA